MGYESYVEGWAYGAKLVPQLEKMGFVVTQDGYLDAPDNSATGVHVNPLRDDLLIGDEAWETAYGFEALIEALHRVEGLEEAEFCVVGEEGERDIIAFRDGKWYVLLPLEVCVEEEKVEEAREQVLRALSPYALRGPIPEYSIRLHTS